MTFPKKCTLKTIFTLIPEKSSLISQSELFWYLPLNQKLSLDQTTTTKPHQSINCHQVI